MQRSVLDHPSCGIPALYTCTDCGSRPIFHPILCSAYVVSCNIQGLGPFRKSQGNAGDIWCQTRSSPSLLIPVGVEPVLVNACAPRPGPLPLRITLERWSTIQNDFKKRESFCRNSKPTPVPYYGEQQSKCLLQSTSPSEIFHTESRPVGSIRKRLSPPELTPMSSF